MNSDSMILRRNIARLIAIAACSFMSVYVFSQHQKPETDSSYVFPAPAGWGIERFPFPIGFAPQIPYKGYEDIRFSPGWAKAANDDYWTYAFLWSLEGEVSVNSFTIESNLKVYYEGLIKANTAGDSTWKSSLVITSFRKMKTRKGDSKIFVGTVKMMDYMLRKPIVLNCKVHIKSCENSKTFLFFELSPKPFPHKVWEELNGLWTGFRCRKQ